MLDGYKKAARAQKESKRLINEASVAPNPYTQFWLDYNSFHKLTYDDFMTFVRSSPPVNITSHEVVAIFERVGYDSEAMANDIARLIRDKHVERENAE